jgi:hypothetical protein
VWPRASRGPRALPPPLTTLAQRRCLSRPAAPHSEEQIPALQPTDTKSAKQLATRPGTRWRRGSWETPGGAVACDPSRRCVVDRHRLVKPMRSYAAPPPSRDWRACRRATRSGIRPRPALLPRVGLTASRSKVNDAKAGDPHHFSFSNPDINVSSSLLEFCSGGVPLTAKLVPIRGWPSGKKTEMSDNRQGITASA